MRVALATICLNSEQFLPKLIQQHIDWCDHWVFVHCADVTYASANPSMVNSEGLSIDNTAEILANARDAYGKIEVITSTPAGKLTPQSAQNKCTIRNQYLGALDQINPDILYVIDDDEFLTRKEQEMVIDLVTASSPLHYSFRFPQRHIWYPPSLQEAGDPMFAKEAIGGYWAVPHCRCYRYVHGMRYRTNHNAPVYPGGIETHGKGRMFIGKNHPEVIHLGFARRPDVRMAANSYYEHRGEGRETTGLNRQHYVDCRNAWNRWKPGDNLPHRGAVIDFDGQVPECFE